MKILAFKKSYILALMVILFAGCANTTAPITGRKQMITVSPQQEMALGYQSAQKILSQVRLSKNQAHNNMVNEVGQRLAAVTGQNGYRWQFFVVDEPQTANAFALPGGKVFIYNGILKYMANKDELAIVMAHEIGHALARHGAERMSSTQMANLGGAILQGVMASQGVSSGNANSALQAYGMASKLGVILPYSRTQEYEADKIGMVLAAKAGYNPNAAISFWQKFNSANGGARGPEYMSTHPNPANRIAEIRALVPQVMPYYNQAKKR